MDNFSIKYILHAEFYWLFHGVDHLMRKCLVFEKSAFLSTLLCFLLEKYPLGKGDLDAWESTAED